MSAFLCTIEFVAPLTSVSAKMRRARILARPKCLQEIVDVRPIFRQQIFEPLQKQIPAKAVFLFENCGFLLHSPPITSDPGRAKFFV